MLAPAPTRQDRMAMHNANKLKIGLFGANCSSGRAVTLVPERWSGNWPDNLKLARMADAAGLDFLLPIGRWKGYGGDTDYQGATLETITWATGLLANTKRITAFGTVHAPLFNPVIAAKEMVTRTYTETAALYVTLPWIHDDLKRMKSVLGEDWWPYGIAKNRHVLETFLRYHHEQGLSARLVKIEELFAPETLDDQFVI